MTLTLARPILTAALSAIVAGSLFATPATAADRNFGVSGFDRVRVDGPFAVTLTTNVAPYAKAHGSATALDALDVRVDGRTLIIRANRSNWGGNPDKPAGPVTISVGTHELEQAALNGAGTLAISRARGLNFLLLVGGSGSASLVDAEVDQLRVSVIGSGSAKVAGRAKIFSGVMQGAGALDAAALKAKDATLSAEGPATIRAYVSNSAKIVATGTATVTIEGGASCIAKVVGSASVNGCRPAK